MKIADVRPQPLFNNDRISRDCGRNCARKTRDLGDCDRMRIARRAVVSPRLQGRAVCRRHLISAAPTKSKHSAEETIVFRPLNQSAQWVTWSVEDQNLDPVVLHAKGDRAESAVVRRGGLLRHPDERY